MRPSGRAPDEMRAITIETGFTKHAEGSCLISFGETRVLCTASVEERIPPWLRGKGEGWVTAEYSMLPRATHTRGQREAAKGKQSGRTQEIQRLIGRSLRAVVDLQKLGERQITLDCDWQLDKSFLMQTFHVKSSEDDFRVVTYIAFDPAEARFRSWFFDSRGGFGGGAWSR